MSISTTGKETKSNSRSCDGSSAGADKTCGGVEGGDDTKPGNQDCCETREIPGGSYNRFNDSSFPAKVSSFKLDTFLVTVGRFRQWVKATGGNLLSSAPPAGAGAHPKIPNSGWRTEWNRFLPASTADVDRMLGPEYDVDGSLACQYGTLLEEQGALTWWTKELDKNIKDQNSENPDVLRENTKDALDRKPLNCVPWHVLFAFCIWDGGRLPTDAEFGYAAAGGAEQRMFPWGNLEDDQIAPIGGRDDLSSPPIFAAGAPRMAARLWDDRLGNHQNVFEDNYGLTWGTTEFGKADNASHVMPVGRRPGGNGKWGHTDLAGNMFEWMLDEGPIATGQCNDCANVNWPKPTDLDPKAYMTQPEFKNTTPGGVNWWRGGARSIRGSAWDNAVFLANKQSKDEIKYYTSYPVLRTYRSLGGRCARDL